MPLPTIVIGKIDRQRLVSVAKDALRSARPAPAASTLLSEIARARTVSKKFLPTNVVAMHRQVEIRDNITSRKTRLRLIYPDEAISDTEALSVVTPMGAALIGLSEGDSIDWCSAGGDRQSVTVLRVCPGTTGILRPATTSKFALGQG